MTPSRLAARLACAAALLLSFSVSAQTDTDTAQALSPVTVTATRTQTQLSQLPQSVTLISREQLAEQLALGLNLQDALAQLVPGLGPSTASQSNFGQTLRGRNFTVLVDGVPQSTPLRRAARDLLVLDPALVERVEVVRGATAAYGDGGAGGLINIITRRGGEDAGRTSRLRLGQSLTHFEDALNGSIYQDLGGRAGGVDYLLGASYGETQSFFDADGNRIPDDPQGQGGLGYLSSRNAFARLDYGLDDLQDVSLMLNYFDAGQDPKYLNVPGQAGVRPATAQRGSVPGEPQGNENLIAQLGYRHAAVAGSRLQTQLYYQDLTSTFGFSTFFSPPAQSRVLSEKSGLRVDIATPVALGRDTTLNWGLDLLRDQTSQPLSDGRTFVPRIDGQTQALFAQLETALGTQWLLSGGVRAESVTLDVEDYMTPDTTDGTTIFPGNSVQGGELDYSSTAFNLGLNYALPASGHSLFAAWTQGFSVADVGRVLRSFGGSSVRDARPEAQEVDNYELGWRFAGGVWASTVAVFYSTSDLGASFDANLNTVRRPEEIYGIEASLDGRLGTGLSLGGTFAWLEGKADSNDDGSYDRYLPGDRIPPLKATLYLEHRDGRWTNRFQALTVGSRDRFDSTGFGQGDVHSYTVVDFSTRLALARGDLQLGLQNLLNRRYFSSTAQWYNLDDSYVLAPGASAVLSYTLRW